MSPERKVATSRTKRGVDVVVAGLGLLILAPLLLLIALVIRLESPGPAIFRQRRTGLHGRPFDIYKFRTMRVTEDGADLRQARRGDSRITPIGRTLRKLSIDELPQLVNVLEGRMSLVGPRPHAEAHDAIWSAWDGAYAERFRAKPGLTGSAQVRGHRGEVTCEDHLRLRLEADRQYIDRWTLAEDLRIIARTIPLLFGDARAY